MENELKKLKVYSFRDLTTIKNRHDDLIDKPLFHKVMVAWREDPDAVQYKLELYLNLKKDFLPLRLCTIEKSKNICYHTFEDLTTLSMDGEAHFFNQTSSPYNSSDYLNYRYYECIVSAEDIDGNIVSQGSTKLNLDRYIEGYHPIH